MITKIADGIYARKIIVAGEPWPLTTYLWITKNHNLYLDAGLGENALLELSEYADPSKKNTLLYSHYHFDHVWGGHALKDPEILAHRRFLDHQTHLEKDRLNLIRFAEGKNEIALPTRYIDEDVDFDDELRILHAPGHTDDGLMVYHKTLHILFMGDVAADEGRDLPELAGSVDSYLATLKKLEGLRIKQILCSHRDPEDANYLNILMENAYILRKNCQ